MVRRIHRVSGATPAEPGTIIDPTGDTIVNDLASLTTLAPPGTRPTDRQWRTKVRSGGRYRTAQVINDGTGPRWAFVDEDTQTGPDYRGAHPSLADATANVANKVEGDYVLVGANWEPGWYLGGTAFTLQGEFVTVPARNTVPTPPGGQSHVYLQTSDDTIHVAISGPFGVNNWISGGPVGRLAPGVNPLTAPAADYVHAPEAGRRFQAVWDGSDWVAAATAVAELAPTAVGLPDQAIADGVPITPVDVTVAFADPEGQAMTYSAAGLPPLLTIDETTGVISGTPIGGPTGEWRATVTATDPTGRSAIAPILFAATNPSVALVKAVTGAALDLPLDLDALAPAGAFTNMGSDGIWYTPATDVEVASITVRINGTVVTTSRRIEIRQGIGVGGALLGTSVGSASLPANATVTRTVNFSPVRLTAGQTYTILMNNPHPALNFFQTDQNPGNPEIGRLQAGALLPQDAAIRIQGQQDLAPPAEPYPEGTEISYSLAVTNDGDVALSNVGVTDPSATVVGGPIPNLAVGATDASTITATHVVTAAEAAAGTYENTATASATPTATADAVVTVTTTT